MSSPEKEEKIKALFESRFLSVVLMICLLLMCTLFIVVILQVFGPDYATRVSIDLAAGAGGGILLTFLILLLVRPKKVSRNILLYTVAAILFGSLIVSLILKFSIPDPTKSSWAFIDASSVGLGITSGISLTYLLLAIFKSSLVLSKEVEEESVEKEKPDQQIEEDEEELREGKAEIMGTLEEKSRDEPIESSIKERENVK